MQLVLKSMRYAKKPSASGFTSYGGCSMKYQKTVSVVIWLIYSSCSVLCAVPRQEDKIVIAIVDFRNTSKDNSLDYLEKTIPESIITKLGKSGRTEIVERARLQDALKEMELSSTGIIDEQSAVELGRAVGAQAILVGSYVSIEEIIRINARLIDVQTGRIIKAETVQGNVGKEIFSLMDELALSVETQLLGESTRTIQLQPIPITKKKNFPTQEKGVIGGLNIARLTGADASMEAIETLVGDKEGQSKLLTYTIGGYMTYTLSNGLVIRPELHYIIKGSKYSWSGIMEGVNINVDLDITMKYLEIPIFGIYQLDDKISLKAGPYLQYYLNGTMQLDAKASYMGNTNSESESWDIEKDEVPKIGYGLVLGGSYSIKDQIAVEARYSIGLSTIDDGWGYNIDSEIDVKDIKHSGLQILVSYSL